MLELSIINPVTQTTTVTITVVFIVTTTAVGMVLEQELIEVITTVKIAVVDIVHTMITVNFVGLQIPTHQRLHLSIQPLLL